MASHFLLDWSPVAVALGPVRIHWYGLMYVLGFLAFWRLGLMHARRAHTAVRPEQVSDLLFYGALGVLAGGRLGSALFYYPEVYLADPIRILYVWEGGMAFHGGLLGVLAGLWLWSRRHGAPFWATVDFAAPMVPIGLFFGRIGNFINGELWGAPSTLPWAVIFPAAGPEPRHPSQLYEAGLEGLALFAVLWAYARRPRPPGAVAAAFALGYAAVRFAVEFVRVPDAHLGYLAFGWLTMGQLLCIPLAGAGVWLALRAHRRPA